MKLAILVAVVATALGGCNQPLPEAWFGAYRLDDGRVVSLRQSTPESLRVRVLDDGATRRYTARDGRWQAGQGLADDVLADTELEVAGDVLTLTYPDASTLSGRRLDLPVRTARLEVNGVDLCVRLTLPAGPGPHPAIIIAQGSGDDAATRTYGTPDFFAANGLAAVAYDKRGTGSSGGRYTMDFFQLADDLAGVAEWVAVQPGIDPARIGVSGYSQGGWIGPLAAARSDLLEFVIANYGMIGSPRAEQRIETEERFRRLGFDAQAVTEAGELADAAIDVMAGNYRDWARYDALAARFRDRVWMRALDEPLSDFERWPHWLVRQVAPFLSVPGLHWDYDSLDALDTLAARNIPSVWLIASDDRSAPNAFTLSELARRRSRGEQIEVRVFERTDHGFLLFEEDADGSRRYGNYHPDYFATEVAIAQRLAGVASGS